MSGSSPGHTMRMKASVVFAVMLATSGLARTVVAQQRFTGVEYLAGRGELVRPFEATLVLDDRELRVEEIVYSRQGRSLRTVFTIPLTHITDVGASLAREADGPLPTGSTGLASPTEHYEYVTLTMEVGDRVEGVVFRVGRQQSADIAREIQSAALNAREALPAPPTRVRAGTRARRPLRLVHLVSRPSGRERMRRIHGPRSHGHPRGRADRLYVEQA